MLKICVRIGLMRFCNKGSILLSSSENKLHRHCAFYPWIFWLTHSDNSVRQTKNKADFRWSQNTKWHLTGIHFAKESLNCFWVGRDPWRPLGSNSELPCASRAHFQKQKATASMGSITFWWEAASNKAGSRAHTSLLVWASGISQSCSDSSDVTSMDQGSHLEYPSPATISATRTVQLQCSTYRTALFQQALRTMDSHRV